ncbi:MAG: DNA sulfur modification protein DndE [Enterovibrio sp.]
MLPSRMNLTRSTEEQLKKLKSYTGVTPNLSARIGFFRSIEGNFRYQGQKAKLDGQLVLDKITWLGETSSITELVLKMYYPDLDIKEYQQAWAAHVEDGVASLRNYKQLVQLASCL